MTPQPNSTLQAQTKLCSSRQCELRGIPQPLENFAKNSSTKDGFQYFCRKCTSRDKKASRKNYPRIPDDQNPTQEKICKWCNQVKPIAAFGRNAAEKDGVHYYCKICVTEKAMKDYRENREVRTAKGKEWKKNNPDKIKEWEQKREAEDPGYFKRKRKQTYDKNPKKANERTRRNYAANRKDRIAYAIAWRKNNPEKVKAIDSRKLARKRNAAISDLTADQWNKILEVFEHRCAYCGEKPENGKLTQDHVIPLSKGGNHTVSNVVPACASCNSKKGNRSPLRPVQPLLLLLGRK